jgi:hypothetical protein
MTYTVPISEKNPQAKAVISPLKLLAEEFDFVEVTKNEGGLNFMTDEQRDEFETRYAYTIEHTGEGKTWNEIEAKYKKS